MSSGTRAVVISTPAGFKGHLGRGGPHVQSLVVKIPSSSPSPELALPPRSLGFLELLYM